MLNGHVRADGQAGRTPATATSGTGRPGHAEPHRPAHAETGHGAPFPSERQRTGRARHSKGNGQKRVTRATPGRERSVRRPARGGRHGAAPADPVAWPRHRPPGRSRALRPAAPRHSAGSGHPASRGDAGKTLGRTEPTRPRPAWPPPATRVRDAADTALLGGTARTAKAARPMNKAPVRDQGLSRGAGDENRTRALSLGSSCSTIKLHPRDPLPRRDRIARHLTSCRAPAVQGGGSRVCGGRTVCGRGWRRRGGGVRPVMCPRAWDGRGRAGGLPASTPRCVTGSWGRTLGL